MPKIDIARIRPLVGSKYPAPFDEPCRTCENLRLGDAAGLTQFVPDGHHLQNRSSGDALVLTVGSRLDADSGEYSDIDMVFKSGRYTGGGGYARKDGTGY